MSFASKIDSFAFGAHIYALTYMGSADKLQFPEFLTTVTGHCSPVVYGGSPVIRSLTFKSNRRTFGPFGVEEGVPFSFPMEGGKIVGFKGRAGWYLDAIGFHITRAKIRFTIQVI
ncbi:UNVERIFIED_CONTAM: Jacalin-related lectin 19 [Sesamum calycinum]|uniref:Jacalin-related lectin 19 n=1 Tax=Sesamum calycinum TaxID=2727403 RepID=A0AAW2SX08_9LAMI